MVCSLTLTDGQADAHSSIWVILPPLFPPTSDDPQLHTRIAHESHLVVIRLAGQIWGTARRICYSKHIQGPNIPYHHSTITFPSFLSRILPPSPFYPSFSISFS